MSRAQSIERLRVQNYRALKDVELKRLRPLTVLVGPNGSGKSTFFDVFAFLGDCFDEGLRRACDKRNGITDMLSRGSDGPLTLEFSYRQEGTGGGGGRLLTYQLTIGRDGRRPIIEREMLRWTQGMGGGRPTHILDFRRGVGSVADSETGEREDQVLSEPDILAVNTLGQFKDHPRVEALRRFITGWHVSYLSADATRAVTEAGPQEHLSRLGDNLPNVLQYLAENHPARLDEILQALTNAVPLLERATHELTADGRLVLWLKDRPFDEPVLARWASDGTMKMLAYLVLLHDPDPAPFIGIEEPENYLYPTLLPGLADECRRATRAAQVLVTSHSHEFIDSLDPHEVIVFKRNEQGYTTTSRPHEQSTVVAMMAEGARLGWLWRESYLDTPDPRVELTSGQP